MEKPVFELQGKYPGDEDFIFSEFYSSLAEAEAFAEANLEEFVIHMRMKLAERKK